MTEHLVDRFSSDLEYHTMPGVSPMASTMPLPDI
jgi:hypothetical protein